MLSDYVSLAVQLLFHHVGLVEIPAVDAGRLGGDELNGRDVEVLTEGIAGQVDIVAFKDAALGENAGALALEVHAGRREQAELLQIVIERRPSDIQSHPDESRVAGVTYRLL